MKSSLRLLREGLDASSFSADLTQQQQQRQQQAYLAAYVDT
jgi:hypothetical protein